MAYEMVIARGLGASNLMGNGFSSQQEFILQVLALTSACVSIVAGCFSLYWFFRIQTHFRHHLITLLICSDLFKAIWYMISAALALQISPARFDHGFCQASGFFLAFGIEASDYAILVIAIHSALCIFRPNTNLGETGLYSIRYIVYALWIALPILAAGLGFMYGGVYISTGAYCYLPLRPFWYRLGLSWVPRYVIFVTILTIYAMIYWFVSAKFKNFHRNTGDSYKQPSEWANTSASRPRRVVSHLFGFWSAKPNQGKVSNTVTSTTSQIRIDPSNAVDTQRSEEYDIEPTQGPAWEHYTFGSPTIPLSGPGPDDITPSPSQRGAGSLVQGSVSTQRTSVVDHVSGDTRKSLIEFLREEPPEDLLPDPPVLNSALVTEEVVSETKARQTAIKRQLRFMFIYPLVYLISWIPPSVQHFTLYNDAVAANPSFPLACVSTCFVALQCFLDSFVFSYRETPWRFAAQTKNDADIEHAGAAPDSDNSDHKRWRPFARKGNPSPNEKSPSVNDNNNYEDNSQPTLRSQNSSRTHTPRSSLIHRVSHPFRTSSEATIITTPSKLFVKSAGKSRAEMIAEARAARHRRALEKETAREGQEERQRQRKQSFVRRGGADRSWWEVEGRKRKDSVLLGLDQDLSRTKSATSTADDNGNIASPSSLASSLFSPRRLMGSFSQTPTELSPRTTRVPPPPSSGLDELSPTDQGEAEARRTRSASLFPGTTRDQEQAMATVAEEEDAPGPSQ